jgi:hypothetical protein
MHNTASPPPRTDRDERRLATRFYHFVVQSSDSVSFTNGFTFLPVNQHAASHISLYHLLSDGLAYDQKLHTFRRRRQQASDFGFCAVPMLCMLRELAKKPKLSRSANAVVLPSDRSLAVAPHSGCLRRRHDRRLNQTNL